MKTSELTGRALDWAVAQSGNDGTFGFWSDPDWSPSTKWADGGPIIEREQMDVLHYPDHWVAHLWANRNWRQTIPSAPGHEKVKPLNSAYGSGPTMLIAAMRCYVASKLGDKVDVPKEVA